jgi:hypothetical protein
MKNNKDYIYLGMLKINDKYVHYFYNKKEDCFEKEFEKFKFIDKEFGIVYFFNKDNISYSYSAIKKYDKKFLNEKLEELKKQSNVYTNLFVGNKLIYKMFNKNGKFYDREIQILKLEKDYYSDDTRKVYFKYLDDKKTERYPHIIMIKIMLEHIIPL